jgi:hypothetical protein
MFVSILVSSGCGGSDLYVSPEGDTSTTIVLINDIFDAGFYVDIDKKYAGFLQEELRINVKPGKRKIKVFNSETTVAEEAFTTSHKFRFEVEVSKGESKTITLAWDDPGYSKDVNKAGKSIGPKEEKKKRQGGTAPSPF